jgi:hypothetical protein
MTEQRLVTLLCLFIFPKSGVTAIDKLLTNNPMAAARFAEAFDVDFQDVTATDLLKTVRDMIHQGHKLRTHPVTSGTAPNGSPFVSVILSGQASTTDFDSVSIIEAAMALYAKPGVARELPEAFKQDFMLIDCEMLSSFRLKTG